MNNDGLTDPSPSDFLSLIIRITELLVTLCKYCNGLIIFGGSRDGELRFCNDTCRQSGVLLRNASQLPIDFVQRRTRAVHEGSCPRCEGVGPIDVHTAHRVWSALLATSWSSHPAISCRRCGLKRQAGSMLFSLGLGWWGIPWGIVWTPMQVIRNFIGMVKPPPRGVPSATLERLVAMDLARQQLEQEKSGAIPPVQPPLSPPTSPPGAS